MRTISRFYYGWVIVAVIFVSFGIASATLASFSVFYAAFLEEFGRSRASTAGIYSLVIISQSLSALVTGIILDRIGARIIMIISAALLGVGMLLTSWSSSLGTLYVSFGIIMAIGAPPLRIMATTSILPNWFVRLRATAQGLGTAGGGTGILLLTPFLQVVVLAQGWRTAALLVSGIVLLGLLPLIALFIRTRPEELGLHPDGAGRPAVNTPTDENAGSETSDWTIRSAMHTWQFYALFAILTCRGFSTRFIMAHNVTMLVDFGYAPTAAATAYGVSALISALANPVSGLIADRIGLARAHSISVIAASLGLISLALLGNGQQSALLLNMFILLYGYGRGSEAPPVTTLQADIFHGRHSGGIYGVLYTGMGIGGAVSAWLAGFVYDTTGHYTLMIALAIVVIMAGNLGTWIVAPGRSRQPLPAVT